MKIHVLVPQRFWPSKTHRSTYKAFSSLKYATTLLLKLQETYLNKTLLFLTELKYCVHWYTIQTGWKACPTLYLPLVWSTYYTGLKKKSCKIFSPCIITNVGNTITEKYFRSWSYWLTRVYLDAYLHTGRQFCGKKLREEVELTLLHYKHGELLWEFCLKISSSLQMDPVKQCKGE